MTITLPPDLAAELEAAAKSRGTTPEALLVAAARRIVIADGMFAPKPPRDPRDTPEAALARALAMQAAAGIPPGESMYDRLKDIIGQVEGDGRPWSQDCGRKFADDLAAGRKFADDLAAGRKARP